jgi:hypothetical protein
MTRSRWAVLAVLTHLAAFVGGYVVARRNVPIRAEERVVTKEVVKWAEKIVKVESTNQQASARENVKVVTRWRTRPDGSKEVEQSQEKQSTAATAVTSAALSTTERAGSSKVRSESARTTVYANRPWSINVLGGLGLDWKRHYGVTLTRDIGSSIMGIWVLPSQKAAGVSVGFRF